MILLFVLQIILLVLWYAMPFVVFPAWLVFLPLIIFALWWAFYFTLIGVVMALAAWRDSRRS
jgi:hypothetical protein